MITWSEEYDEINDGCAQDRPTMDTEGNNSSLTPTYMTPPQLARLSLSMNGETLYCGIMEGGEFNELTAEEFALKFEEAGFLLLREYWRNSNKVPSIRYKAKMLWCVVTNVLNSRI